MTDTPWTKGPWGDSRKVVLLRGASWLGFANYESPEAEANARLIAAAPDMAEALAEFIAIEEDPDTTPPDRIDAAFTAARAALAKAKGETK